MLKNLPLAPIEINIDQQELNFYPKFPNPDQKKSYQVSTSKYGVGEKINSQQTPRGLMQIRAKIGDNLNPQTVFSSRRPLPELFNTHKLTIASKKQDWIMGRILWLSGLEPYFNRYKSVDTQKRFIYIHGIPEIIDINKPDSIGCIRMITENLVDIFQKIQLPIKVYIREKSNADFDIISLSSKEFQSIIETTHNQVIDEGSKIYLEQEFSNIKVIDNPIYILTFNRKTEIVGIAKLLVDNQKIYLSKIVISKELWAHGVGYEIIKKIITISKNLNCHEILLNCKENAIDYFQKIGFKTNGLSFQNMEKKLIKMKLKI